jgi:hypothetical protein
MVKLVKHAVRHLSHLPLHETLLETSFAFENVDRSELVFRLQNVEVRNDVSLKLHNVTPFLVSWIRLTM